MTNKKSDMKITILLFLALIFINSAFILNNNRDPSDSNIGEKESEDVEHVLQSSASTISIYVFENNFSGVAGISGDGSYITPWIIQDKIIDGGQVNTCIFIEDSDEYFRIENCTLFNPDGTASIPNTAEACIKIDNSGNGTIINNTCYDDDISAWGVGMFIIDCVNMTITDNYVYHLDYGMVYRRSGINLTISNNRLEDHDQEAFYFMGSSGSNPDWNKNILVTNNRIEASYEGIYMSHCLFANVTDNYIYDQNQYGIYIYQANNGTYSNNILLDNRYGIDIRRAENNTIFENTIEDNSNRGLRDTGTADVLYNIFYKNSFINNNQHVTDDFIGNYFNNTEIGNYWDDYTGPDIDDDGIGDLVYNISSDGLVNDSKPIRDDGIDLQNGVIEIDAADPAKDWAWAEQRFWCSGSGTGPDPYVIGPSLTGTLEINGSGIYSGITILNSSSSYFRIQNSSCFNSGIGEAGINIENSSAAMISLNNLSSNLGSGIKVYNSTMIYTYDNIIRDNTQYGIFYEISNNSLISGNFLSGNGWDLRDLNGFSNINGMNEIDGIYTPLYLDDNGGSGTAFNWVTAANMPWCSGSGTAIDPYLIEDKSISGNNSQSCIIIQDSSVYYKIDNCSIYNSTTGSFNSGIVLANVQNGLIVNNNISFNYNGIYMSAGSNCTNFTSNYICNNSKDGVFIYESDNNTFIENIICNSTDYGIFLEDLATGSDNNSFVQNQFIGNGIHAKDEPSTNFWNNTIIGNYWDNYTGVDDNDDTLGDTPHVFTGGIDWHPIWSDSHNGSAIHIDDSDPSKDWTWAESMTWCSGSGTSEDPYKIEDLIINSHYSDSCIKIENSQAYFRIENCTLYNAGSSEAAIYVSKSENGYITNNNLSNNQGYAVLLHTQCNYTTIENNYIYNITDTDAIRIYDGCTDNNIFTNNITGVKNHGISCESSIWSCDRNNISYNIIFNNTADNKAAIYLKGAWYSNITGNQVFNNTGSSRRGIDIHTGSQYNDVFNNIICYNDGDGITTRQGATGNTVSGNDIFNNTGNGVNIPSLGSATSVNFITYNRIENNSLCGINSEGLVFSAINVDNKFLYNNISQNGQHGIRIYWSMSTQIIGNIITNHGQSGNYQAISIDEALNNNITHNEIINNTQGGIYLPTYVVLEPTGNLFHDNNFINNSINALDNASLNSWNNSMNGNTWDNYDGFDTNYDGVGETPYNISGTANAQDQMPFGNLDTIDPVITIISPVSDELLNGTAPAFIIEIDEYQLNTTWYSFNGGENKTFTGNGSFDPVLWGNLLNGTITIRFYANDTINNIGMAIMVVRLDIEGPAFTVDVPSDKDLFAFIPPDYNLTIISDDFNSSWYMIVGYSTNITFIGNGTINQTAWDSVGNGTVTIRFYTNDTFNNIQSIDRILRKDIEAPQVNITLPINNQEFENTPNYILNILEANLHQTWYSLDGGLNNYSCAYPSGLIGAALWAALANGNITITFYANDTMGNIGMKVIYITRYVPPVDPGLPEDDMPWWLRAVLTGAISATVGLFIKQAYSSRKKRNQMIERMSEEIEKIDNLGKFLQSNLSKEEWAGMEVAWKQYQGREITQKDLIKQGKKSVGDRFASLLGVVPAKKKTIDMKKTIPPEKKLFTPSVVPGKAPIDAAKELTPEAKKKMTELEEKLNSLKKAENRLDLDLDVGDISKEDFKDKKEYLAEKVNEILKKIEDLQPK